MGGRTAAALREIMADRNLTQAALARKLGVSRSHISRILKTNGDGCGRKLLLGVRKAFPDYVDKFLGAAE